MIREESENNYWIILGSVEVSDIYLNCHSLEMMNLETMLANIFSDLDLHSFFTYAFPHTVFVIFTIKL